MANKGLFVLVEGPDDHRFFEAVIRPNMIEKYKWIRIVHHSRWKPAKKKSIINNAPSMQAEYLYVEDLNDTPCVTNKKEIIDEQLDMVLANDRIAIVIREIESWYLSGLTDHKGKSLKVRFSGNTNDVTKEKFNSLIPKRFDSRIDFMVELLKYFSVPTARRKNKSFAYFWKKHIGCTPLQR